MDKHPIKHFIIHTLVKQAITFEEQTIEFYQRAADRITLEPGRLLLLSFAEEEAQHKLKLEQFLSGDLKELLATKPKPEKIEISIDTHSLHRKITGLESESEIFELAIMKEQASYSFYRLLSQKTKIHSAKQVFLFLAQQEQSHLHKLEAELQQNQ
jgi:rubrerythrin